MVHRKSKLALLLLASCFSVNAVPTIGKRVGPVTVPLTYHLADGANAADIVKADRLRARKTAGSSGNVPIINIVSFYSAPIEIGTQTFTLLVDTGSSNTWVGAGNTTYVAGPTSVATNTTYLLFYGSGDSFGNVFNDTVTIGGLQATGVPIGNATEWGGLFGGTDGIAGFGPQNLTWNTVTHPLENGFPTILTSLVAQRGIANVLGVYFKPESGSDTSDANGELTIGGTDPSKYSGSLTYAPVTTLEPFYAKNWAVDVSSITYGSTTLLNVTHPVIVDTGTTFTYIPESAFDLFINITGGAVDPNTSITYWTSPPTGNLAFTIGGKPFTLTPSQYVIPPAQLAGLNLGLNDTVSWGWILNGGVDLPELNVINFLFGQKFLENFYSVFDTDQSRIGFAVRK